MGKLIVIEGSCDGVGKSTQYKLLVDRLSKDKNNIIVTHHFPSYGTYQGRPVEEYLRGNYGKISNLSPYKAGINAIQEGNNLVVLIVEKCHKRSSITTIAFSFKKGKASMKLKISPGETCAVSKNKKSNLIFKSTKNLCGWSPVNNFQFFASSGKYSLSLYPVN